MDCSKIGCNKKIHGKNMCYNHYMNEYQKKYYKNKRKIIFEKFGNCCQICCEKPDWTKSRINLEFHHVYYENGRKEFLRESDGYSGPRRLKEVEKNPERFELLCFDCHKIIGIHEKYPNKVIVFDKYMSNS